MHRGGGLSVSHVHVIFILWAEMETVPNGRRSYDGDGDGAC